ncbi:MAG: EamA family transporter [Defluviitaleaceae bacterium]|nr:EamA family transporter [Defluviitaleaceae bacterium]
MWLLYAVGAAVFASLSTILAKIGIKDVDSHLATAIRTMVVLVFAWIMVFVSGVQGGIFYITSRTWVFLVLSGLATGASWLCFFRALQLGDVNKVVPIDKSSTILTMMLAFIFLREPVGVFTVAGMVLMGIGTWLMLEFKSNSTANGRWWPIYAILAAVFASLVAIFGKIGVADIDASLWTAIRTVVVVPLSWTMVFFTKKKTPAVRLRSWVFLVLSGVATGGSWLFFYHALQIGNASLVVPIDKLSIVLTMGFAFLFLKERFSKRSVIGLVLLTVGTLLPLFISY